MAAPTPRRQFLPALVSNAVEQLVGLDILVNNAAYQERQPSITDITAEQYDQTMKTNVYATFWITKPAIPHLSEGSTIINTSWVVAEDAPEILLDYSATKAAIREFIHSLAKQLTGDGIRVNAVPLGPFWTPLQVLTGQKAENVGTFGSSTPLGRPGPPAEIAPI